ncbi:hypothetical protein AVEN_21233-1 [Araneus ventricosus]|uniref:Uncharacterized protein n=1 Tax=Araneus ventricosus TaxID=182803 RepID=A0A4Y2LRI7_ARAVE|nr:hypothetical protein AVEN_21233-1 [Araneus ventricosus]
MGSQRFWNLLNISIRRGDTLECTRRFHVTPRPAAGRLYKGAAWMTEGELIHWERLWSFVRSASWEDGELSAIEGAVIVDHGSPTMATNLATWQLWRRSMGSQRCWNLLNISIRRESTLECTRGFHVTPRPAAGDYIRRALG